MRNNIGAPTPRTTGQMAVIGAFVAMSITLANSGCSSKGDRPELAPVAGTVTLDGKPLARATVVFHPEIGKVSRAKTNDDGHYQLVYLRDIMGAKLGEHMVSITTWTEEDRRERLPPRYHQQSELKAEVTDGKNTFDFDLSSR